MQNAQPQHELIANCKQLCAIWTTLFVIAGATFTGPPVMFPALKHEFHATDYEMSWLPGSFLIMKGAFSIPGGYLLARYGASLCIKCGTVMILLASACYPFAQHIWFLMVLHGIYGMAFDLCGLAPIIVFTTSWFEKKRALGIGIVVTAFSMSGTLFPAVAAVLIDRYNWRVAAGVNMSLLLIVAAPVVLAVLRDGPLLKSSNGKSPVLRSEPCNFEPIGHRQVVDASDGQELAGSAELDCEDQNAEKENVPLSFSRSLKSCAVWQLVFMSLYQAYIIMALLNMLVLYLKEEAKLPLRLCSKYSSTVFVASTLDKALVGMALDTPASRLASICSYLLFWGGTALALDFSGDEWRPTANRSQLGIFSVVYGLGYGCSFTVLSSKPAKMFGKMQDFGKLQGFLMLFQIIGGFLGTLATGKLRDATGNYNLPFCIFVLIGGLSCVHCVLLEFLGRKGFSDSAFSSPIRLARAL